MLTVLLVLRLVQFYGPNDQLIEVNPAEVTSIREPRGDGHFSKQIHCVIFLVDGKFIAVLEDCKTVERRLELVPPEQKN